MDPRTRVIRPLCTKRVCDPAFPYYYNVELHDRGSDNETSVYYCTEGTPEVKPCSQQPIEMEPMSNNLETQLANFTNLQPQIYNETIMRQYKISQILRRVSQSLQAEAMVAYVKEVPIEYDPQTNSNKLQDWARKVFSPEVKEALSHLNILWDNLPLNLLIQVVVVTICYVILHKGYKGAKTTLKNPNSCNVTLCNICFSSRQPSAEDPGYYSASVVDPDEALESSLRPDMERRTFKTSPRNY